MTVRRELRPFMKYAGGKTQLLPEICRCIPSNFETYYEPFLGGGAVLFHLQPSRAIVNDLNYEIVNLYTNVRDNLDDLIIDLSRHQNDQEYYYQIRSVDRSDKFLQMSAVERASRTLYLNRTAYNGLYRTNKVGQFNAPFGHYEDPKIINEELLRAVQAYLLEKDISIWGLDFEVALQDATDGDFVYCDPPYDRVSTSSFTNYYADGFNRAEQVRLKMVVDNLNNRGCKVLVSNAATPFILDLYKDYDKRLVSARRSINSDGMNRGPVTEVLVKNF